MDILVQSLFVFVYLYEVVAPEKPTQLIVDHFKDNYHIIIARYGSLPVVVYFIDVVERGGVDRVSHGCQKIV